MKITAEEKIMYQVMKVIYDSGIPINFKGSMVLKACLMEAAAHFLSRTFIYIKKAWTRG